MTDDPFVTWLETRDAATLERAWKALGATTVQVGAPDWNVTRHGAARLAAAMLGWPLETLAWLGDDAIDEHDKTVAGMPPIVSAGRSIVRGFLEESYELHGDYYEEWNVREQRQGDRGVQYVRVTFTRDEGGRDGIHQSSGKVVRIYDRAARRGAVVVIESQRPVSRTVAMIDSLDLAPLDLVERLQNFRLASPSLCDENGARALIAQLAAEVDAHFDVSTEWAGSTIHDTSKPSEPSESSESSDWPWVGSVERQFASGPRSVVIHERRFYAPERDVDAKVVGLDWGHELYIFLSVNAYGTYGHVKMRMPLAAGTAVLDRLVRMHGAELT